MSANWTARYKAARVAAQKAANADGLDRGIEKNDVAKSFRVFVLPRVGNRFGHELRCEVVSCEDLSRCQPGHGPSIAATAPQWPLKRDQHGYPPHDHPMQRYREGKEVGSCGGPLVLPSQAGAVLDAVCKCGRVEQDHAARGGCELGFRPSAGCLYCAKCKAFVVADDDQIDRAHAAARAEGAATPTVLTPPPEKKRRGRLDASKVTRNLFDGLPQYHAKLRPDGAAR